MLSYGLRKGGKKKNTTNTNGIKQHLRSCVENKNKTTVIQNLNVISNSVTASFINIFKINIM